MNQTEVFPTMITPYHADGSIDYSTAEQYVQWYYDKGCTGIFSLCQSSEIFFMTLEERVHLNHVVWRKARQIREKYGKTFTIISSGHISDTVEDQIRELCAVAESGTDVLVFITNRLDPQNQGDDVWISNAERLLDALPADLPLGLYESPYPYKRLVTDRILTWCRSTGRFRYMKDTCCNAAVIQHRNELLQGSGFQLLNANCQTLLDSLKSGGGGYCGIMANFHPELYVWLCNHYLEVPEKAELLQALLGTAGFTENGLPYPLTAKYHMCLEGIPTVNHSRSCKDEDLTPYVRACVEQMRLLCKTAAQMLP